MSPARSLRNASDGFLRQLNTTPSVPAGFGVSVLVTEVHRR